MMLRPGQLPPPGFLQEVCCKRSEICCPRDQANWNPSFKCCDRATEKCTITDKKGECETLGTDEDPTPEVLHLETSGQCPEDGSIPLEIRPAEVWRCTLNSDVSGYTCPDDSHCVRDNSGNKNSGVCCRDTTETDSDGHTTVIGCNKYTDCKSCVINEDNEVKANCGWLSQGSLQNNFPRCVENCDNFPQKSCILPHREGNMCPVDAEMGDTENNSTVVNTGTCKKRCNYVGTGRAAGVNNNGNRPTTPGVNTTVTTDACCMDYSGDYCCDKWGQIAAHCTRGRVRDGPLCGIPTRGTPNALYVPEYEPLGPYMPALQGSPWPSPYGQFPIYGQPYGYGPVSPNLPYGPYGPRPYGPGPVPYGPSPYGPWRSGEESEVLSPKELKQQLMMPPPPAFYPMPPPNYQRRIPTVAQINPSPFVCSCDETCSEMDDCCDDYSDECVW